MLGLCWTPATVQGMQKVASTMPSNPEQLLGAILVRKDIFNRFETTMHDTCLDANNLLEYLFSLYNSTATPAERDNLPSLQGFGFMQKDTNCNKKGTGRGQLLFSNQPPADNSQLPPANIHVRPSDSRSHPPGNIEGHRKKIKIEQSNCQGDLNVAVSHTDYSQSSCLKPFNNHSIYHSVATNQHLNVKRETTSELESRHVQQSSSLPPFSQICRQGSRSYSPAVAQYSDTLTQHQSKDEHKNFGMEIRDNRRLDIRGDHSLEIRGDRSLEVRGDHSLEIRGDRSLEVRGDHSLEIRGDRSLEVRGDHSLENRGECNLDVRTDLSSGDGRKKQEGPQPGLLGGQQAARMMHNSLKLAKKLKHKAVDGSSTDGSNGNNSERIGRKKRTHQCFCGALFTRADNLKRHIRKCHEEKLSGTALEFDVDNSAAPVTDNFPHAFPSSGQESMERPQPQSSQSLQHQPQQHPQQRENQQPHHPQQRENQQPQHHPQQRENHQPQHHPQQRENHQPQHHPQQRENLQPQHHHQQRENHHQPQDNNVVKPTSGVKWSCFCGESFDDHCRLVEHTRTHESNL